MPRNSNLTKFGEERMVADYLTAEYPDDEFITRVRLGSRIPDHPHPASTEAERKMSGVFRRWADVAVIRPAELVIVEASIRSDAGDPSKLLIYGRLVPHTPELQPFLDRPLVLELVVAIEDPVVTMVAEEFGIRVKTFAPTWFPEYLAQLNRRERRAPQARGLLPATATEEAPGAS